MIPSLDGKTPLDIYAQKQMTMKKIITYNELSQQEKEKYRKEV